jgi:hypothetical protein
MHIFTSLTVATIKYYRTKTVLLRSKYALSGIVVVVVVDDGGDASYVSRSIFIPRFTESTRIAFLFFAKQTRYYFSGLVVYT